MHTEQPCLRASVLLILMGVGCTSTTSRREEEDAVLARRSFATAPGVTRPAPLTRSGTAPAAELRVRVEDRSGAAVQNATVSVAGAIATTDANGDAALTGLAADALAVVQVYAPSHLGVVRRIEALDEGVNRLSVALTPVSGSPQSWISLAGADDTASTGVVTVEDEAFSVDLPAPDTLQYASGAAYDGDDYDFTVVSFDTHGLTAHDTMAWTPGPLLTDDDEGGSESKDALQSLGMIYIQLTDPETGLELQPGAEPISVRRVVAGEDWSPAAASELPGDGATPEWWFLDADQGVWTSYGVDTEITEGADGGWIVEAELPHLCYINLDIRKTTRCLTVNVDLDEALLKDAALHVTGYGVDQTSGVDQQATLLNVPYSALTLDLMLYDAVIGTNTVPRDGLGQWSSNACTQETSLAPDAASGLSSSAGALIVRLRSGDCPVLVHHVTVRASTGAEASVQTDGQPLAVFSGLPVGTYTISAYGEADEATSLLGGGIVNSVNISDTHGPTLATMDLSDATLHTPAGGCAPLPCSGEACDSSLTVTVLTPDGSPATGAQVELSGLGRQPLGPDGARCFDLPGLADQDLNVSLVGGDGASPVSLPRGGSCRSPGSGATLSLISLDGCPDGERLDGLSSQWLGPEDPRFYDLDTLTMPSWLTPGTLEMTVRVAKGELEEGEIDDVIALYFDAAEADAPDEAMDQSQGHGALVADVWAWEGLDQDPDGATRVNGVHLRADGSQEGRGGLRLDFDMPLSELLSVGSWTEEALGGDVSLTVVKASDFGRETLSGGGYDLPTMLHFDLIEVSLTDQGALKVALSGARFEVDSGWNARLAMFEPLQRSYTVDAAIWTAPLAGPGPSPLSLAEARPLTGSAVRRSDLAALSYGPTGADGTIKTCLPSSGEQPYALIGAAYPGAIPGITPLLRPDPQGATLWSLPGTEGPGGAAGGLGPGALNPYVQAGASWARGGLYDAFREVALKKAMMTLMFPGLVGSSSYRVASLQTNWTLEDLHTGGDLIALDAKRATPATAWAPTALYHVDRAWLASLYADADLPDVSLDAVGSALVTLDLCPEERCRVALTVARDRLSALNHDDCGSFEAQATDEATFAPFLNLDPSCGTPEEPYVLTWTRQDDPDEIVAEIPFVLEPGTALVLR